MATIDHIEPLSIDATRGARFENERLAVLRLCHGLEFLYSKVKESEAAAVGVVGDPVDSTTFSWGNTPGFHEAGIDIVLIACAFDWYAINACRLFALLGFVSVECAESPVKSKAYLERVCGPVLVYRNKVAAHYARTAPRPEDNEADLYVSTIDTVAFDTDRFFVGSLRAGFTSSGVTTASKHDYRWSLTKFHETVVWPRLRRPEQS